MSSSSCSSTSSLRINPSFLHLPASPDGSSSSSSSALAEELSSDFSDGDEGVKGASVDKELLWRCRARRESVLTGSSGTVEALEKEGLLRF